MQKVNWRPDAKSPSRSSTAISPEMSARVSRFARGNNVNCRQTLLPRRPSSKHSWGFCVLQQSLPATSASTTLGKMVHFVESETRRGQGRGLDRRAYSHGWNVLEQLRGWSMQDCIAHRDASTPNVLCILVAIEKLLQPGREEGADS